MTLVVKVGGARAVDPGPVVADVAALVEEGEDVVLTHGGSTAVDEELAARGIDPEYVETPDGVVGRFTDEATMRVVTMALAGRVNTDLVVALRAAGADAVGLSGVDGGLLTGPRTSAVRVREDGRRRVRRGDHSGRVESVNADLLADLLGDGYTPVLSPPMLADDGVAVNVDADRVAAAVAGALGARLVVLTDVPGVLADPDDESTLIDRADTPADLADLEAAAEGFMTRKVMAAVEALEAGAAGVTIAGADAGGAVDADRDGDTDPDAGGAADSDGSIGASDADAGAGDAGADGGGDADTDAGDPVAATATDGGGRDARGPVRAALDGAGTHLAPGVVR